MNKENGITKHDDSLDSINTAERFSGENAEFSLKMQILVKL